MYPGPKPPGQKSPVSIGSGSHWKGDEFTLLQAACLWAGIEPLDSFQDLQCSPEATARYQMLTRAVETGDLEATHPNPAPRTIMVAAQGEHAPDMLASREDLEKLATSMGEKPVFLFPASAGYAHEDGNSAEATFTGSKRRRERDPQAKISVAMRRKALWAEVRAKWPDEKKRPPVRQMAREIGNGSGYAEETRRKILSAPPPN
jgi:hypothetical protein